jgi:regulator of RNase E activity RraA
MVAADLTDIPTTALAELVGRSQVMDMGIKPLWHGMPRMAGPAFTVRCPAGDHLMFHAAIYEAPPGSVLVAEAGSCDYALAGGNVCAVAQRRGVRAFVVDGSVRDVAEIRSRAFPVFGRGVIPFPGAKEHLDTLNDHPVRCGGVVVSPGDWVVADEDGVIVIPQTLKAVTLQKGAERTAKESAQSLEEWESAHREKIRSILQRKGRPLVEAPSEK